MKLSGIFLITGRFLGFRKNRQKLDEQSFASSVAKKSLRGAVLGIALCLVPLIVVQVVADGMISGMLSRIQELSSYHAQFIDFGFYGEPEEYLEISRDLEKSDVIKNAYAEKQGSCIVVGKKGRIGSVLRAVDPHFFTEDAGVHSYMQCLDGELNISKSKTALIGSKLANSTGLSVGDSIRILTLKKNSRGVMVPKVTTFKVGGIFSSGFQDLDALWVFVPFTEGCSILETDSSRTLIGIKTHDVNQSYNELKKELRLISPLGFSPYTWMDLNSSTYQSYMTTKMLLQFIMFLILLVAVVHISSALILLVMERRKEIAILKSMGASPFDITIIFLLSGLFTGFCGILLGIPLGILCSLSVNNVLKGLEFVINFFYKFGIMFFNPNSEFIPIELLNPAYYLETIPVNLNYLQLFVVAAGTLVLSILVSISPAIRAGKEKSLHILRKL